MLPAMFKDEAKYERLHKEWLARVGPRDPIPPGSRRADASELVQESSASAAVYVFVGVTAAVFLGFVALGLTKEPNPEGPEIGVAIAAAVFLGLPLLTLIGYMVRGVIRKRRFGRLTLRLNSAPALGRELSAELAFERCPREVTDLVVTLNLEGTKWYVHRDGRKHANITSGSSSLFSSEHKFPLFHTGEGARAMLRLPIPANLPASDPLEVIAEADQRAELDVLYHFWTLQVRTEGPGADAKEEFYLPVQP